MHTKDNQTQSIMKPKTPIKIQRQKVQGVNQASIIALAESLKRGKGLVK